MLSWVPCSTTPSDLSQHRAFKPDLKSHMADLRLVSASYLLPDGSAARWAAADRTAGRQRRRASTSLTWKSMAESGTSASLIGPTDSAEDSWGGGLIEEYVLLRRSSQGEVEVDARALDRYAGLPSGPDPGKGDPVVQSLECCCRRRSPLMIVDVSPSMGFGGQCSDRLRLGARGLRCFTHHSDAKP